MKTIALVLLSLGLMFVACKQGTDQDDSIVKEPKKQMSVIEAVCTRMDSCKAEQMKKLSGASKAAYDREVPSKAKCMKMLKKSQDDAKNKACAAAVEKASCDDVTEMRMKECKHLL